MFRVYYPGNIRHAGHPLFLVSKNGNIYGVDGGVPDRPGFIAVPEQVYWAVVLTSNGSNRFVEVYSAYYSFLLFQIGAPPWSCFQEWIDRGSTPHAPVVYFQEA